MYNLYSVKFFENSIKLLTSPFLAMLQTFFTHRALKGKLGTPRALEGHLGTRGLAEGILYTSKALQGRSMSI